MIAASVSLLVGEACAAQTTPQRRIIQRHLSGEQLLERCRYEDPIPCRAYIQGVLDGAWSDNTSVIGQKLNIPPTTNGASEAGIVIQWLTEHPGRLADPAAQLVIQAMLDHYGTR